MPVQTTPLEVRLTDPHAAIIRTAGGTPVMEVDTLTLSTKLTGRLLLNGIDIGPQLAFFNGSVIETIDLNVESDGTTITLSLEQHGGGDLTLVFSTGMYAFASIPAATVALTAGTDTVPRLNYIFIPRATGVLTANITGFPTEEHSAVATVIVQSAVTVAADGALKVHAWTDHAASASGQGHSYHINEWIRARHSNWVSGVAQTLTITPGAPDILDFATTAGVAFQLHTHPVPAFNTATGTAVYVVNDFTTKYLQVTDLADLLTDSANVSMAGRYFSLVLWASVSEKTGDCKLFVNLPSGSYNKQGDAEEDVSGYTNFSIPAAYKGAAFLISRLTLKHSAAGGGTWVSIRETDLRGDIPSNIAGGGTQAITTEFADSTFRLFDEIDPTKLLAFQLAGITAGNLRTLTVPDASGTVALTSDLHSAVTLAADADTILTLVGQVIGLDPQVINTVFAGPAAGIPADPSFRALVDADIPAGVMRDAEHLALGAAAPHHAQLHGAADHNAATLPAGFNENFGAFYYDIGEIAVPANPGANVRRVFLDNATGELSVRTNAGATVSLEAAAGGVAAHNLLDGVVHLDTILQGCSRGSLIYGTSGLLWDEFIVGALGTFLRADGVDVYYGAILDADIPGVHSGTAHHVKFTAAEAVTAVEAEDPLNLAGIVNIAKYLQLDEIAAPGAGAANKLRVYAKDLSALSGMFYVDEAGNEFWLADSIFHDMPLSSTAGDWTTGIGGTGVVALYHHRIDTATGAAAGVARISESLAYLGITQGSSRGLINWDRRILFKVRFALTFGGAASISRISLGRLNNDASGDLDDKAVGIKITTLALAGQVHSGGALTTTGALAALVLDQIYDLLIISDGAGNVEWFLDGVSIGASVGGPVGAGALSHAAFRLESVAVGAAQHGCQVFRYGYADLVA